MKLTNITSQITFDETHFDVNKNFSKVYRCGYIVNVCFWGSIKTRYGGALFPVGNLPVPMFTQRCELVQDAYESSTSSSLEGFYSEIDYLGRLAVITNSGKIFAENKLIFCTYTYLAESLQ